MKYLYLILSIVLIVLIVLIIWTIYRYAKYTRLIKQEPERIKVGRDLRPRKIALACALIWIIICGSRVSSGNAMIREIESGKYDDKNRPAEQTVEEHRANLRRSPENKRDFYTLFGCFWLLDTVMCVLDLTRFKYRYITPKGVYYPDDFRAAEKYTYKILDEKLILYYKKMQSAEQCAILEDKEGLMQMLEAHYKPHVLN